MGEQPNKAPLNIGLLAHVGANRGAPRKMSPKYGKNRT